MRMSRAIFTSGAAAEGGQGGRSPSNIPVGGGLPPAPNKTGSMMTECVLLLLLLHVLDALYIRAHAVNSYNSSPTSLLQIA